MSDFSDQIDTPDPYQSSGEEWSVAVEKKRSTRRTSQRLRKKPRITMDLNDSSDSENEKKHVKVKKMGKHSLKPRKTSLQTGLDIVTKDFMTGGFIVLKQDLKQPIIPMIWRIDGKALLQKYEPYEQEGRQLHRSTSVYTGWSIVDKDNYAPVIVKAQWHHQQDLLIETNFEELKRDLMDSD